VPSGFRITNDTRTGFPAVTGALGANAVRAYVRAAWIVGKPEFDELPPHPLTASTARSGKSERRLIRLLSGRRR
jgi:hypothetical protein